METKGEDRMMIHREGMKAGPSVALEDMVDLLCTTAGIIQQGS